jgi:hypothetical protein
MSSLSRLLPNQGDSRIENRRRRFPLSSPRVRRVRQHLCEFSIKVRIGLLVKFVRFAFRFTDQDDLLVGLVVIGVVNGYGRLIGLGPVQYVCSGHGCKGMCVACIARPRWTLDSPLAPLLHHLPPALAHRRSLPQSRYHHLLYDFQPDASAKVASGRLTMRLRRKQLVHGSRGLRKGFEMGCLGAQHLTRREHDEHTRIVPIVRLTSSVSLSMKSTSICISLLHAA